MKGRLDGWTEDPLEAIHVLPTKQKQKNKRDDFKVGTGMNFGGVSISKFILILYVISNRASQDFEVS